MNNYEMVFILNTTITEETRNGVVDRICNIIKENGEITKKEDMGEKRLAYEIKKQKTGYYYVIYFSIEPNYIAELERVCRITDEVMKFIVVKVEE